MIKIHIPRRTESRQWTIVLFIGTLTLYAARVALPICVVQISREYSWSKTESVSFEITFL